MALLCFTLDLLSLPSPLLKDLKQLANLYAISSGNGETESSILQDRIGLCFLQKNKASDAVELRMAYSPQGKYNLCDFHHAVNSLPTDGFLPEMSLLGAEECAKPYEEALAKLLRNKDLSSWGSKDIPKKVVLITSCLLPNIDALHKPLTEAAEKYISLEFVFFGQESDDFDKMSSKIVKQFSDSISNFNNCSLRSYFPNIWILRALVKGWLQDLKDKEESLQALVLFKIGLVNSVNQIFCNLFPSVHLIIDGFSPCQTCRCHGLPIDGLAGYRVKGSCPLTFHELEACDFVENAVRIGKQTVLFLPSFQSSMKLKQVSAPIVLNVIERTKLSSLSEGVVIGTPYIVTPTFTDMEDASGDYKSEVNLQLYRGLCQALYSLDEGLICSSNCNTLTMMETTFQCFYILQPSESGPLLLRRLAGSEEILPLPDGIQLKDALVPEQIGNSIRTSLSKLDLREYNPVLHERGLHLELNWLVKESLRFGSILPPTGYGTVCKDPTPTSLNLHPSQASTQPPPAKEAMAEEKTQSNLTEEEDKAAACISSEWEELIVNEVGKSYSPTCISKPKPKDLVSSLPDSKPLDEKTFRILERLEAPRQQKTKESSLVLSVSNVTRNASRPMKPPLLPFEPDSTTDHQVSSSQPLKPNFQRAKRKVR